MVAVLSDAALRREKLLGCFGHVTILKGTGKAHAPLIEA
jgi:hypothetical protein